MIELEGEEQRDWMNDDVVRLHRYGGHCHEDDLRSGGKKMTRWIWRDHPLLPRCSRWRDTHSGSSSQLPLHYPRLMGNNLYTPNLSSNSQDNQVEPRVLAATELELEQAKKGLRMTLSVKVRNQVVRSTSLER